MNTGRRMLGAALAASVLIGHGASAATLACHVDLDVTDQDPNGLNVRAAPDGPIITALKARSRWVEVEVTGQDGAWARIKSATLEADENDNSVEKLLWKGVGWVALSKLGIDELSTNTRIYAAPSQASAMVLSFDEGDEAKIPHADILGCEGDWLHVRVKGLVGWTQTYCNNQLTTCV